MLNNAEQRLLSLLLSPSYVRQSAEAHGTGDPVLGVELALREIRAMVRAHLRVLIHRTRNSPEKRLALRQMLNLQKHLNLKPQRVLSMEETSWRQQSRLMWKEPSNIYGTLEIDHVVTDPELFFRCLVRCLSDMLAHHLPLNRAFLNDRVWQRLTPEVMVNVQLRQDDIAPLVINAWGLSDQQVVSSLKSGLRGLLRARRHELWPIVQHTICEWLEARPLVSFAGVTVSSLLRTGVRWGHANIPPNLGIPIAVTMGDYNHTLCKTLQIGITVDHRVLDAGAGGAIHNYLRTHLVPLYQEGLECTLSLSAVPQVSDQPLLTV